MQSHCLVIGWLVVFKLKEQTKMEQQKIAHLEDGIKYLEEANRDLKNDKNLLLSQIKGPPQAPVSTGMSGSRKTAKVLSSSSTSSTPSSDSSDSSHSSSSEEEKKKKKKQKMSKKHTNSHRKLVMLDIASEAVTTTDGFIHRYGNALRRFTKCGTMKKPFVKMNVDRNTIARTAVLAITFPDTFKELLPSDEDHEKISEFAERCRSANTNEMAETMPATQKKGKTPLNKYT
ncbi:uncharacterized protein LKV04_005891 [Tautogolabrus adspersus]